MRPRFVGLLDCGGVSDAVLIAIGTLVLSGELFPLDVEIPRSQNAELNILKDVR